MSDQPQKQIGDLTVQLDRRTCIGSGNCTKVCGEVFALDEQTLVTFTEPLGEADRDDVLEACRVCPVDAIIATDGDGNQLVP